VVLKPDRETVMGDIEWCWNTREALMGDIQWCWNRTERESGGRHIEVFEP
jgi:hypothetical protein